MYSAIRVIFQRFGKRVGYNRKAIFATSRKWLSRALLEAALRRMSLNHNHKYRAGSSKLTGS
jgi:hypothetical protein